MRLSDCFVELIGYVAISIKMMEKRQPSFDKLRTDIQNLISESEVCQKNNDFSKEDYDQARFAVFAWIDETLLSSSWKNKTQWQMNTLQNEYYGISNAGEVYFEQLNNLGIHQRDVREMYYLCLAMGFKGLYVQKEADILLERLKTSNLKVIIGSSAQLPSLDGKEHFQEAYPDEDSVNIHKVQSRASFPIIILLLIGIPVAVYFSMYFIFNTILNDMLKKILS